MRNLTRLLDSKNVEERKQYFHNLYESYGVTELLFDKSTILKDIFVSEDKVSLFFGNAQKLSVNFWHFTLRKKYQEDEFLCCLAAEIKNPSDMPLLIDRIEKMVSEFLSEFNLSHLASNEKAIFSAIDFGKTYYYVKELLERRYEKVYSNIKYSSFYVPELTKTLYVSKFNSGVSKKGSESVLFNTGCTERSFDEIKEVVDEGRIFRLLEDKSDYLANIFTIGESTELCSEFSFFSEDDFDRAKEIFESLNLYSKENEGLFYSLIVNGIQPSYFRDSKGQYYLYYLKEVKKFKSLDSLINSWNQDRQKERIVRGKNEGYFTEIKK